MRLVWITDPHLNHAAMNAWQRWIDKIREQNPDALLLTGDVSEGDDVEFQLRRLSDSVEVPIYFVLGNHDFYGNSIAAVRQQVVSLCRELPSLHYLSDEGPIELVQDAVLLGDDGWGDARQGDYEHSPVQLNDFRLIEDFRVANPETWKSMLIREGERSAARLEQKLRDLPDSVRQVIIATHVPPYRQACWYEGHTTDDLWAPFFVCGAMGHVLDQAASWVPKRRFIVVCGHTHHDGVARLAENLTVYTGAAEYGEPAVEANIDVEPERLKMTRVRKSLS